MLPTTNSKLPPLAKLIGPNQPAYRHLLSFDPGEHIGWAYFKDAKLMQSGMIHEGAHIENLETLNYKFCKLVQGAYPERVCVVIESYHVYKSKAKDHINSDVPTLRVIGALEMLCVQARVPYTFQSAAQGKGFVTDARLQAWGFLKKGMSPHEADALRHGVHFLLFGGKAQGGGGRGDR